jgi:hypothetical protein
MGDEKEAFNLLAPKSREVLIARARLASDQAGHQRAFKPQDLIATNMERSRWRGGKLGEVTINGAAATVKLASIDEKESELLQLVQVEGRWRVLIPSLK